MSIFGTVPQTITPNNKTATTGYVVDKLDPVNVTSPVTIGTKIFNYAFYTSPLLENGQHTITVTAVSVDTNSGFFFDYLEYIQLPNTTTALSSSTPSPTGIATPGSTIFVTPEAQSSSVTTPQHAATNAVHRKSHSELSIILPATLVPIVFLLLIVATLMYYRRRRRQPKPTSLNQQYSDRAPFDAFTEYPARPPQRRKRMFLSRSCPSHL